ncbi:MAG: ABC transporter permease [Flavobacterium sp.]|uniref:ABC transporter permease n=2 Tax=Flavobacterium sp. TaxID=239 RepID=UPI0022BF1582|nr:ABC transporter permease [Flavobacterium sp.]MCZ8169096.1 ABC transporter permease [Flavobacterium sp.]MCZ8297843.1 ABC transporter permease [Flavobacterium sp.]
MNLSLYIARRYLFSRSKNTAINIITGIASLSVIVGAMALFVVLSVFSGLRTFSLSFSNDLDPDLKVFPKSGTHFTFTPVQAQKIKTIEGVAHFSQVVEKRVMFLFDGKTQFSFLKGVDAQFGRVSKTPEKLFNGQWLEPNTYQVVIGYGLSEKLSLGLLDYQNAFEVYAPKPGRGDLGLNPEDSFIIERIYPVGIYAINEEMDNRYVFADLQLAQAVVQLKPHEITNLEIRLQPNASEAQVIAALEKYIPNTTVKNRAQLNETLYKMLNSENVAVYLIFTLVIIMALFSLAGALIMMILDKKNNLKTLFSLGVTLPQLRRIFFLQGTLLSIFGGMVGLILGSVLVVMQQHYQLIMITETLAYPIEFHWENLALVWLTVIVLGMISSGIASSRVSEKMLD